MELDATAVQVAPKKLKPARKQVKVGEIVRKEEVQTGKEYNIWYNKWAGGDRQDNYSNQEKAQTRCNIKKDTGFTRADAAGTKFCCLFFSRGLCPRGYECEFLHRLPVPDSESSRDCFGRAKFSDYKDDMGGVGSFSRQNRTLYVGRIRETGNANETEEVVTRHFKEWGKIERVKILQHRSVAFVTYEDECYAQFAKEAMACQSLDNDEILNVRWATEDPNPTQKVAEKRRLEEIGTAAIQAKLDPRMVDAMRAVRALEDGEELPPPDDDEIASEGDYEDEVEDDAEIDIPPSKRRRLALEATQTQNQPQPGGLLSAETIEGLRYFAQIRQARGGADVKLAPKTTAQPENAGGKGLGVLGDYGSDDESD